MTVIFVLVFELMFLISGVLTYVFYILLVFTLDVQRFFKLAVLFVLVTEFLKLLFYYECFNITFTYSDIVYLISYSYFNISYCFICFRVLAL